MTDNEKKELDLKLKAVGAAFAHIGDFKRRCFHSSLGDSHGSVDELHSQFLKFRTSNLDKKVSRSRGV